MTVKFCLDVYIALASCRSTGSYSALHKYWNSKDKIALLAMESRHLQILLKDEYETKLQIQNVTFYY